MFLTSGVFLQNQTWYLSTGRMKCFDCSNVGHKRNMCLHNVGFDVAAMATSALAAGMIMEATVSTLPSTVVPAECKKNNGQLEKSIRKHREPWCTAEDFASYSTNTQSPIVEKTNECKWDLCLTLRDGWQWSLWKHRLPLSVIYQN